MHDGNSQDLEHAILRHGGEALRARDAFAALGFRERLFLITFLQSL